MAAPTFAALACAAAESCPPWRPSLVAGISRATLHHLQYFPLVVPADEGLQYFPPLAATAQ